MASSRSKKTVTIEPLENRCLMSVTMPAPMLMMPFFPASMMDPAPVTVHKATRKPGRYVVAFYGLGGANSSYGNEWLPKIADSVGHSTRSHVNKYREDQETTALTDLLTALDTNADHVIELSESAKVKLRIIGYSFGGVAAANLTRDLNRGGETVQGFHLDQAVKVRSLVTLDPVNHNGRHTDGVTSNVKYFSNYYQQRGGTTKVDVYIKKFGIKVHLKTVSVDDPLNITGDVLPSEAPKTKQVRVDTVYSDDSVSHDVESGGVRGRIKGKDVNHGTLPFFIYDAARRKLKR